MNNEEDKSTSKKKRDSFLATAREFGITELIKDRADKTCKSVSAEKFAKVTETWTRTIISAPFILLLITFVLENSKEGDVYKGVIFSLTGLSMLLAFVVYILAVMVAIFGNLTANKEKNMCSKPLFAVHNLLKLIFYPAVLTGLLLYAYNEGGYYLGILLSGNG